MDDSDRKNQKFALDGRTAQSPQKSGLFRIDKKGSRIVPILSPMESQPCVGPFPGAVLDSNRIVDDHRARPARSVWILLNEGVSEQPNRTIISEWNAERAN